jgi:V-type H+-transporting ATPase subunit H
VKSSGKRMDQGSDKRIMEKQYSMSYPNQIEFSLTVRRLVELLKTSKDPVVLSIAAHDIGKFVAHGGDKAKKTISDLEGKTRLIELIGHDNAEVRYRALMSVQRLMSQHV